MSVTLTISEEKFSKDELGRNVTTLTQIYYGSISYELSQELESIISEADEEEGLVEYCNYNSDPFEVYGSVVDTLLKHISKKTEPIRVVGGVENEQLYEISMSC